MKRPAGKQPTARHTLVNLGLLGVVIGPGGRLLLLKSSTLRKHIMLRQNSGGVAGVVSCVSVRVSRALTKGRLTG